MVDHFNFCDVVFDYHEILKTVRKVSKKKKKISIFKVEKVNFIYLLFFPIKIKIEELIYFLIKMLTWHF